MQCMTYQPIDDPELTLDKIYASLPSTWFMMKQIVATNMLASDTDANLDGLNVLQVSWMLQVSFRPYDDIWKFVWFEKKELAVKSHVY